LTPPPIKLLAQQLSLPLIQPARLKDPDAFEQLRLWKPDLIVVVAFGQILRQNVLDLPPLGCLNVHASLLPRWRGPAPVQAAILNGDTHTGVTIMRLDAGVDTGPILSQRETEIYPGETSGELGKRLAVLGADLLIETLPRYLTGDLLLSPQDHTQATYAPLLRKEDGFLDFDQPTEKLVNRVRAFNPWPGAFMLWLGTPLKVLRARSVIPNSLVAPLASGQRLSYQGWPAVATCQDILVLEEVQPPGKKPMPGKAFLQGTRHWN
jgi:methionyl-tRNA formyltransferase